jgi:putative hydroxymethylpyrimidine transport system substrate-binding protein
MRTMALALVLLLSANGARAAEPFTVILDWFVNPDHAPLIVAQEQGFFAAQNLDVELVAPADPADPAKLVAAGRADLGISYQPELHLQVEQGLPLVRIGTLIATPLNALIVRADSGIEAIEDLRGRQIGFSVTGFEDAVLGTMLRDAGLEPGAVELINVNFALTPALLSGQVDAVIGGYRTFEMIQLDLEGVAARAFFPEEHGVPVYDELIYIANRERLDDPRLGRFLTAVEHGMTYLVNHPDESYGLFVRAHPDLDDELNRRAFAETLPRFALRPFALDSGRYATFARFLEQNGLIKAAEPAAAYAVELARPGD